MDEPIKIIDQLPSDVGDFHVHVEVHNHHMDFRCYECIGIADWSVLYHRKADPFGDIVDNTEEAQVFLSGFIKWDGCANIRFDEQDNVMLHFCGRKSAARVGALIDRLYDIATEIPSWDGELGE